MESNRIAKRVYVGRARKRWLDTVKECLRKRGLDVRQVSRMVRVCEEEYMGHSPGDEPLTLTRYHSCGLQQLYEALEGWKSICG